MTPRTTFGGYLRVAGVAKQLQSGHRATGRRVEHDYILVTFLRDQGEQLADQVALHVDHQRASARLGVLLQKIRQHRRLAGAGPADDQAMAQPTDYRLCYLSFLQTGCVRETKHAAGSRDAGRGHQDRCRAEGEPGNPGRIDGPAEHRGQFGGAIEIAGAQRQPTLQASLDPASRQASNAQRATDTTARAYD